MIPKTICLVIAFKSSIVFLSSWESLFPTTIRQVSQSCVGVFPLLICSGGFHCFPIAKISHHYHRVTISDENSPKLRNLFHSQIWDPGISNFSFSWSNNSTASVIVLGSGLIKVLILSDDDGDTCKFWVVTFSSLERTYRSQSQVFFINLFCLWYKHKQRHEPLLSHSGFHCFVRVTRIQVMSFCLIYIVYSNETHRCSSCFYQDNLLLNILSSMFWRYWRSHFSPAMVLENDAIHSNTISEKDRGSLLYGVLVHDRKEIHHLPLGRFMSHIDTIQSKTLDCIRETNIHDAIIRLGEDIHKRTKDFKAYANIRWIDVMLLHHPDSIDVTSDFKKSIWVLRQRRLHNDHRESLPKSSILLISLKRQDPETFSTTTSSYFLIKVMPKAFWSLSSKLLANHKCVKEGHNRLFHLLAWQTSERIAWLLSTLSSKLFQFPIFAYNGCFVLVLYFVNSF